VEQLLRAKLDLTAIDGTDWKGLDIDVVQTSYVNRPTVEGQYSLMQFVRRRIARTSERKNATGPAKIIHRGSRSPLIAHQLFPWTQQPKAFFGHPMNQRASANTDRTVASSNVIDLGLDFEPDLPAMAASAVGVHGS
jgi:hypothetical protein